MEIIIPMDEPQWRTVGGTGLIVLVLITVILVIILALRSYKEREHKITKKQISLGIQIIVFLLYVIVVCISQTYRDALYMVDWKYELSSESTQYLEKSNTSRNKYKIFSNTGEYYQVAYYLFC